MRRLRASCYVSRRVRLRLRFWPRFWLRSWLRRRAAWRVALAVASASACRRCTRFDAARAAAVRRARTDRACTCAFVRGYRGDVGGSSRRRAVSECAGAVQGAGVTSAAARNPAGFQSAAAVEQFRERRGARAARAHAVLCRDARHDDDLRARHAARRRPRRLSARSAVSQADPGRARRFADARARTVNRRPARVAGRRLEVRRLRASVPAACAPGACRTNRDRCCRRIPPRGC